MPKPVSDPDLAALPAVQWHWSSHSEAASRVPAPVAAPALASPPRVSHIDSESSGLAPAPRVLHIDSDAEAALALAALLKPEAQVCHAPTLERARCLLEAERFALVILDPDLGDGDGAALLDGLAGTPVLLYTQRDADWRGRAGAVLRKPWASPRQLWGAVAQLLGIAAMPHMTQER